LKIKEIKIVAKTNVGKKAIETALLEQRKLNWQQRSIFRMLGFKCTLVEKEPYTCEIQINNPSFRQLLQDTFVKPLIDVLELNGAKKDFDYELLVVS
jgi:hypothetical protein